MIDEPKKKRGEEMPEDMGETGEKGGETSPDYEEDIGMEDYEREE